MKKKAVSGVSLPLVLGLAVVWLALHPNYSVAQECGNGCDGCRIGGSVNPADGDANNDRTVEVSAFNFGSSLLFANRRPWGSISGCVGTGSVRWIFQARGDTANGPNAPAYDVSPWVPGASCTGNGPNTLCQGTFSIVLHQRGTAKNHKAPENRPRFCTGNQPPPAPSTVGQPVSVVTGNMFLDQTDFVMPAWGSGINLTRSYNSINAFRSVVGHFGRGWSHTYERNLEVVVVDSILRIWEGIGVATLYSDPDGDSTFEAYAPKTETSGIVESGGLFTRNFPDGSYETYDGSGNLTTIVDPVGNTTILSYTADQLTDISDPADRTLSFVYQGSRIVEAHGPAGLVATYTYDTSTSTELESVTYPDGSGFSFNHDESGQLLRVTDHQGIIVESHTYKSGRALTSEISGGIDKYTLDYDTDSQGNITKTTVTDALDNVTEYEMIYLAGMFQVTKITGPCSSCGGGGSETQEWLYWTTDEDGALESHLDGRVVAYKDGLGNTTTYTYDANGYLASETDPLGRTTSYTNDSQGRILTLTDPEDQETTWTHGPAGPLTIMDPLSRTTTLTYHVRGKPETVTDPRQTTTTLAYDGHGNMVSVTDPLLNQTEYGYDLVSRRISVTDPLGNTTRTEYDLQGRVKKIIKPDGTFTEVAYDLGGRRTSVTDALGHTTQFGYDAFARLATVTDPPNAVTTYSYDQMSNLTSITDARGNATTFEVDAYGRVGKVTSPMGSGESFSYDAAGRLVKKVAGGSVIQYVYDTAGQLTSKQHGGQGIDPFGSPPTSESVTYEYDQQGRLTEASQATGLTRETLSWTYDAAGQMLTESSTANRSTISYTYDTAGNRKTLSLNGALFLTYGYDAGGRLTGITRGSNVFTFEYDAASRRTSLTYPNDLITTYDYDTLSRVTDVTTALGQTDIAKASYSYDLAGNRLSKTTDAFTERYSYDPLYRLASVSRDFVLTEDYGYDEVGNRVSSLDHPLWTHNNRNQLLSFNGTTFSYDTRGNTVSRTDSTSSTTYQWDEENRLTQIRIGGRRVTFEYDPLGRRLLKRNGSRPTTRFAYDGMDILTETVRPGRRTTKFIHGPGIDEPLAAEDAAGNLNYYHADGLGSIVNQTDEAGRVVSSYQYDGFGNIDIGASQVGYSFTGREWDPETGLYYYRARYYDPDTGRFLSPDPLRFLAGSNFYSYALNNPINFRDPNGLQAGGLGGGLGGVLSGPAGTAGDQSCLLVGDSTGGIGVLCCTQLGLVVGAAVGAGGFSTGLYCPSCPTICDLQGTYGAGIGIGGAGPTVSVAGGVGIGMEHLSYQIAAGGGLGGGGAGGIIIGDCKIKWVIRGPKCDACESTEGGVP